MTTIPRPVSVAIVDDSPVVFEGVAALLKPFRHRVRVAEYAGPLPQRGRADVVLYDPFIAPNSVERLREIARESGACVLVYAWAVEAAQIGDAMKAGAVGHLSKTVDAAAMVSALEAVVAGKIVKAVPVPDVPPKAMWPGEREGLSARESVIVSLIVAGMSNRDIASALHLSVNSVKPNIRSAYRKMDVASRTRAVLWGIQHGFEIASPAADLTGGQQ